MGAFKFAPEVRKTGLRRPAASPADRLTAGWVGAGAQPV